VQVFVVRLKLTGSRLGPCACKFCFWAYVSGYLPFISSDLFLKLCLLIILKSLSLFLCFHRFEDDEEKDALACEAGAQSISMAAVLSNMNDVNACRVH